MSVGARRTYERLPAAERSRYGSDLEVLVLVRSRTASSLRQSYRLVYRRTPSGRDYRRLERNLGGALTKERGRISVRPNDRLWRGDDPPPVPTPDGVLDAASDGLSWRQRSVIGRFWSLAARERTLTDQELERELKPFRRETFRVLDPATGRIVRRPLVTDVAGVRAFARTEGRQERVISPRVSPTEPGALG